MKVLIVEDEIALLQALEHKMIHEGYEVSVANDGVQGLEQIRAVKPDLVLLDILMPNLDGFGVLEKLSADKVIPKLPVIIISNSGQPVEIDRALKLGARDYLVKAEFDPEEVVEKVHKVMASETGSPGVARPTTAAPTTPPPDDQGSILPPDQPAAEDDDSGRSRILLIEDDQFLRDLMERKLLKEGFAVATAIEGEAGLAKVATWKPDLVLLDIILPGLDGFSILEKLKANPAVAAIPVILLTNLGQRDDVEKGLRLGAVGYLVKAHFTPGDIVEKVKSILKL